MKNCNACPQSYSLTDGSKDLCCTNYPSVIRFGDNSCTHVVGVQAAVVDEVRSEVVDDYAEHIIIIIIIMYNHHHYHHLKWCMMAQNTRPLQKEELRSTTRK